MKFKIYTTIGPQVTKDTLYWRKPMPAVNLGPNVYKVCFTEFTNLILSSFRQTLNTNYFTEIIKINPILNSRRSKNLGRVTWLKPLNSRVRSYKLNSIP